MSEESENVVPTFNSHFPSRFLIPIYTFIRSTDFEASFEVKSIDLFLSRFLQSKTFDGKKYEYSVFSASYPMVSDGTEKKRKKKCTLV